MDDSFDPEQLGKIMNLIKIVKAVNENSEEKNDTVVNNAVVNDATEANENDENTDILNGGSTLNAISRAIPYLEPKYQKNMEIMLKMMELEKIINSFSTISIASNNPKENKKKMLMAIKPELDSKRGKMLDLFVRVIEIKDIMEDIYE